MEISLDFYLFSRIKKALFFVFKFKEFNHGQLKNMENLSQVIGVFSSIGF